MTVCVYSQWLASKCRKKIEKFENHLIINQGWAIPGSEHQYYTQYYTGQKLLSNTNTQYQYYTESQLSLSIFK